MMSRREKTKRRQRAVRRAVVSTIWGIALCALAVIAMPSLLSASVMSFLSTPSVPTGTTYSSAWKKAVTLCS